MGSEVEFDCEYLTMNEQKILARREFLKYTGAGLVAAAAGCTDRWRQWSAGAKLSGHPNILWIMMDDCRADALGCYGKPWPRTPHMDAVADRGVRFETAVVQGPVCVPSRTSMKSGYYAHCTGVMAMGQPPSEQGSYLADAGPRPNLQNNWKQAGIAPVNVGKRHAYEADWDHRGDITPQFDCCGRPVTEEARRRLQQTGSTYPQVVTKTHRWAIGGTIPYKPEEISTSRLGDLAVDTLKELAGKDQPFFLRVSFHAPHVPFRVAPGHMIDPETIDLPGVTEEELKTKPRFERENLRIYSAAPDLTGEQIGIARGSYYGMVSLVDEQVGKMVALLKKTGALNNTIIVINSDQGLLLGEHGLWKKRCFYDQNVCVPFILSCPDRLPSHKVIKEPVEMIDFLPTLMELSGLEIPGGIQGRSLMPLIRGQVGYWKTACFCEHDHSGDMYDELRRGGGRRVMVRTRTWKLVYFMDERVAEKDGALYNLQKDPEETNNLYGQQQCHGVVRHLERLARRWDRNTKKTQGLAQRQRRQEHTSPSRLYS